MPRFVFVVPFLCSWAFMVNGLRADEGVAFFEAKIRPLLAGQCYECHSVRAKKVEGGLLLDSRAGVLKGGDSGPALVPGKPDESLMLKALTYRDSDLQMPPDDRLDDAEIGAVRKWIAMGAPDPRDEPVGEVVEEKGIDYTKARASWAYQRPREHVLPSVENPSWARRPLDHFVLSRIEKAELAPSVMADRRILVRRAYLDLHGLPPTTEQVEAFLLDNRGDAWERLIDELLASPRYGERWGRHWLDVARYADSNGMDENIAHPNAWRYRDYVIRSFNEDKPFNRFIVEQLAGDLLPSNDLAQRRDQTTGLGFLSVGPKMLACDDPAKMRRDIVDEQIDTMGRAFMGMTLGCARCHDHKFDPIPTEDYYGLAGIFLSTKTLTKYTVVAHYHQHDFTEPSVQGRYQKIAELTKRRKSKKTPKEEKEKLKGEIEALKKDLPPQHLVMGVREEEKIEDTKVHLRGNYLTLGREVPRRLLTVIAGEKQGALPNDQSGRLELARWIASDAHPLTARVIANRLWRWHFGRGIVSTPDNFGVLGAEPTHPELLDHLALLLIKSGWSLKSLHREIMGSATYRQSSHATAAQGQDPENKLFARWAPRRVEAEVLRDSILFKSNRLDLTMGGGMIDKGPTEYASRGSLAEWVKLTRRTVYLPVLRSGGYEGMIAFDFADPSVIDGNRRSSTVTPQALYLMNSPLVHASSTALAKVLLEGTSGATEEQRVGWMTHHLYGRPPRSGEVYRGAQFVRSYRAKVEGNEEKAWAAYARVLFASNEFLYIE